VEHPDPHSGRFCISIIGIGKKIAASLLVMTGFVASPSLAQVITAPVIEWHNAYDAGGWEWFHSVAQTADGGYVGVGERYLLKIDAIGGIEWAIASSAQLRSILPWKQDMGENVWRRQGRHRGRSRQRRATDQ
jgi:hypothetical protein